jgi:hypothetical protein
MKPITTSEQICQMIHFKNKNPYLGKFWKVLLWKMVVYFTDIWSILWPFDICYGRLVH